MVHRCTATLLHKFTYITTHLHTQGRPALLHAKRLQLPFYLEPLLHLQGPTAYSIARQCWNNAPKPVLYSLSSAMPQHKIYNTPHGQLLQLSRESSAC